VEPEAVDRAARALIAALRAGGKLLALGNGGSAADAQHVAAELVGRFERERAPLPAIALTTDSSALTAIGNDYGFEEVFARQIDALARPGDVALAISTSGSSCNVLRAVARARRAGVTTIGMCGAPGCELCGAVDVAIAVRAQGTAAVQEAHLCVEHALCRAVERELFGVERRELEVPKATITLEELVELRAGWAAANRTVVWTNGCFDIIHAGHLASLEAAKRLGDILVVGVNSDRTVSILKGEGRPLMPEEDRAALIAALRPVDHAVIFDEETPEKVLSILRPDIHCKGADYAGENGKPVPERAVVEGYGGRVEFLPLVPDRSTTALAQAIRGERA
jgi:phosphoheptose isomerase